MHTVKSPERNNSQISSVPNPVERAESLTAVIAAHHH